MQKIKLALILILTALIFAFGVTPTRADELEELNKKIEEYTGQINRLQSEASTLSNQIAEFDARINLTIAKIAQTQEQIKQLGGRIDQLEISLGSLTEAFNSRAEETYKMARIDNNPVIMISSDNIDDAVSKYFYLQKIQEADNQLISRLEAAKTTYNNQKTDLEELEKVLGTQKAELDTQKTAKANLLAITRNDEKKYQELLEQAREEYKAIQAIIAGSGDETKVGSVKAGDKIASIIQGPSCNSNGAHLHFIVSKGKGVTENPFTYLKPGITYENCSGPGGCGEGDPFNPTGSWEWPIAPTVKYSQGYGSTWATRNTWVGRIYSFHNGIDINSTTSSDVKAVQDGILYRGSFGGSGGCRLRYVRVAHNEGGISTFYLHINY